MSNHYTVDATPETVHWGYFDARREPVLTIDSGDEVTLHTLNGEPWDLPPDESLILPEHREVLEKTKKSGGVHQMTGPVYVRGAEPGDVLQVDILEAVPRQDWGYCSVLPLLGTLPMEFTDYETIHIRVDRERMMAVLPWGPEIELDPFFGIMGVAPPREWGRQSSTVPWAFGGNMDNKELRPGTTLYLPIFNEGALFSAGDGHGVQGDGEVCITALETSLTGRFRLTVRKDLKLTQPFAESETHLISIGMEQDLDDAAKDAVREMVRAICERTSMNRNQAYMLCSLAGDLRVTQLVDGNKGVHMMLAKKHLG